MKKGIHQKKKKKNGEILTGSHSWESVSVTTQACFIFSETFPVKMSGIFLIRPNVQIKETNVFQPHHVPKRKETKQMKSTDRKSTKRERSFRRNVLQTKTA